MDLIENGVGAAVTVNGIAVPIDSFVRVDHEPYRGRYRVADLGGIPLSYRSYQLLFTPIPELMRQAAHAAL